MSTQLSKSDVGDLLEKAYWKETEMTINYIAIVNNTRGWQGAILRDITRPVIQEKFNHVTLIAHRIRLLGYSVPNSIKFRNTEIEDIQNDLSISAIHSAAGSVEAMAKAENDIITLYKEIINGTLESDAVTANIVTGMLAESECRLQVMNDILGQ